MDIQLTTDCIKEAHNFGSTVYHNICTGTETAITWGAGDWAGVALVTAFCLVLFGVVGAIAYEVLRWR